MKILGRIPGHILGAAAVVALLAGPAAAQMPKGPARYGETDKDKTPAEKAADREAERAYQRSLGNIPEQKSVDPWGIAREPAPAKPAKAETAPAKPKAPTKSADTKSGAAAK